MTAGGRVLAFGLIGLSGFAPNLAALWLLTALGVHYLAAEVLANQAVAGFAVRFAVTDRFIYVARQARSPGRPAGISAKKVTTP